MVVLWFAMAGIAYGQATVEAGLGAARAATSTAPAKGLGKSMSGLAGSLDKALKATPSKTASSATGIPSADSPSASTPSAAPAPAPSWEDPGGIEPGLSYEELVRRFGPSAMSITSGTEKSLSYTGKAGMFQVTVQDGKVASIAKPKAVPPGK
jgi:hypothetical protein